ncbi:MAG: uL15 family ribosomal protein [Candidatus Micrarchaeia archaeon]
MIFLKRGPERKDIIDAVKILWKDYRNIAKILLRPRRKRVEVNLEKIEKVMNRMKLPEKEKLKKVIVIPGKVLGKGEIKKPYKIVSLSASAKAKEKIEKIGSLKDFNWFVNEKIKDYVLIT